MNSETKFFGGIILVTLVIVGGAIFFLSQPPAPLQRADESLLVRQDSPKISTDSARLTLVEFGDYQCPACAVYHPMVNQLLEEYKDLLTFVFREFPLSGHQHADITARAAVAAGFQHKYWEMHTVLYEKQTEWSESKDIQADIINYAKDLGLDMEKFQNDLGSQEVKAFIDRDKQDGYTLGVNATPTFYFDGYKMQNPAGYADFKAIVEEALKNTMASEPTIGAEDAATSSAK